MQESDFTALAPGKLIRNLEGELTFLPDHLPPTIVWTNAFVARGSRADRAFARVDGIGSLGQVSPRLLMRPFLRREAVLSSQIEGTQATFSELLLFEEGKRVEDQSSDLREVFNYVSALEYALETIRVRPITASLLRDIHSKLMTDVRGGDKTPGAFRRQQVFIGRSSRIADARFVPPPALEVQPLMTALERFLQSPAALPPLIHAALVHYQFEAIHPFHDGNGRVGRLLLTLMLCDPSDPQPPLLYLSAYFERNRQQYYDCLLAVSQHGEWTQWLDFVLEGVTTEASDVARRIALLNQLRMRYVDQVSKAKASATAVQLIDELFQSPVIGIGRASAALGLTPAATKRQIDRLVDLNVLRKMNEAKRNMLFIAPEIIAAISDETQVPKP